MFVLVVMAIILIFIALKFACNHFILNMVIYFVSSIVSTKYLVRLHIIIINVLTNGNLEDIQIWRKMNIQLGNYILSNSLVIKWHKLFKTGSGEVKKI